jgi:hypothetical protein
LEVQTNRSVQAQQPVAFQRQETRNTNNLQSQHGKNLWSARFAKKKTGIFHVFP